MTSLTVRRPPASLTLSQAADPPMSPGLSYHVRGGVMIHAGLGKKQKPHFSPAQGYPSADEIAEAARLVRDMEAAFAPASPATILGWMLNLRTLPNGPKDDAAVKSAVGLIAIGCGNLPSLCWTPETLAKAAVLKWFPSPHDLDELLRPIADAARNRLAALKRIAEMQARPLITREPYPVQTPPPWVSDRMSRHLGPAEPGELDPAEALRSRDAQLAALGFKPGPDGKPIPIAAERA